MATDSSPERADVSAMVITFALGFAGGYADAATYMLSATFSGHVTGNTVLAAISLGTGNYRLFGIRLLALALFIFASAAGIRLSKSKGKNGRRLVVGLLVEAASVALAPVGAVVHSPRSGLLVLLCLSIALGLQNGVFSKSRGISVHGTYITGDVSNLLTSLIRKEEGEARNWSSKKRTTVEVLSTTWLSFIVGAALAGFAVHRLHTYAVWLLLIPMLSAACVSWTFNRN